MKSIDLLPWHEYFSQNQIKEIRQSLIYYADNPLREIIAKMAVMLDENQGLIAKGEAENEL